MNEPFEMCQVCGDRLVVEASGQSYCAACRDALMNQVTAQLLPESIFPGGHRPTTTNAASGGDDDTGMLMQPVIPGLRMIRFIDGGGMGVVWLAEQEATGREVAVKLIRASGWGRNAMARARFEREIELAARLDHPNIARVFHGGEADGEPYCVMEFIPGVPVTMFVKRDGWSRAQTLTVIRKICEAVDHAHRRGVLHRDLKPSNILVTADGEPKLLDFGLARALDGSDMTLTVEGGLAGTPAYMSPEQAKGETKLIDTRSDVYSLGVICYELLTGRPPYEVDGTMAGMIRVVSMAEVKRPRAVDRSISPELEMFLLHALAASPSDRYESAGQMGEDVRRYLQQEPLVAGRTSTKYFVRKWMARHKLAVAASLAVAAIMATALTYHWRTLRHEKETAQNAEAQARELLHRSLKVGISENLQRGAFTSALQMIDEAMQIGHPNRDELLFQRIEALEALNDPEAISLVESLDPKTLAPEQRPRLAYWKGERLLQNGKAEEGLALLNQSLAAGLPPVEERLARAALSATVREAIEHYQAAAALAPWRAVAQRNLALALVLSGRVEEARTQIGICHLLFPADENLYMLEVIMEGFQGNVEAAAAAAAKIPKTPRGGGGALYASAARPLAGMARDMVRAMQGLAPKSSLAEQLALRMVVGKLLSLGGGTPDTNQSIPGLNSAPPILARGINGFIKSLQKFQNGDKKGAAKEIRSAVSVCEDGSLWALLAAIEVDSGNFSEVVEAAKKAQTLPCLMSGVHDAAKVLEASAIAALYVQSKDPVQLEQSAALFREIYRSNQNNGELMHSMPLAVAFKSGDLFLARLVAESMPRDSADQLTVLAKIEYGGENHPKALQIVEKAMSLFPEDTSLTSLHEKIVAKSLEGFPDQPRAE